MIGPFSKKFWGVIIGMLVVLLFASCFSYPIVGEKHTSNIHYWDENLPREESVELGFGFLGVGGDDLTVTSYNGIPVDWGRKPLVFLPPGETVFTVDYSIAVGGNTLHNGSSIFAWNFKAGDRFILLGAVKVGDKIIQVRAGGPTKEDRLGIILWDMDVKKDWDEYDFVPFPAPEKTILE
ncbi:MAG: hypothetical protein LBU19_04850 [Treponema sp.]|jgi:hypothetical protein|nr:hypothetical protein [Treponema sp.]